MKPFALFLSLLLVSPILARAQDRPVREPPDSTRGAAAAQFRQQHGPGWQVRWHPRAGTPATLRGGTARGYTGPPEQAGRAFLQDHRTLFGLENAEQALKATRTNASRGNTRILYQQVYRGLPVLYSGYLVALDQEGSVYYVSGDYYPDLKVENTTPALAPSAVVGQIRAAFGGGASFTLLQEPTLAVYVDDDGEALSYHLAYEVRAERSDPLDAYKYVIDAQTGDILQKISLINEIHAGDAPAGGGAVTEPNVVGPARMVPGTMVSGTGEVYLTNPLHGSPVQVTLRRLDDVSPRVLEGDHVAVTNEEEPEAESATGTFIYSPSDTHFDEVMTYYHSDEFEQWLIDALGMDAGRLNDVVEAETHSSDTYAGTNSSQGLAFFSDGEGHFLADGTPLDNPTQEAAIITHEYMHIVSETFNSLEQDSVADALDEGYSDFFAVANRHANTSVSSARLGESVGFKPERTVDNSYQVDDFYAGQNGDLDRGDLTNDGAFSEHDGGAVLAGALWDVAQSINDVQLAAEITLESLNYLDGDPSFVDARDAVVAADQTLNSGQHECTIKHRFADHGIGLPHDVTVSGDGILNAGETGHWSTYVECPGGSTSYEWAYREAGETSWTILFGANGSTLDHSFCTDVTLRANVTGNNGTASDDYDVSVSGSCPSGPITGHEAQTSEDGLSKRGGPTHPEQFGIESPAPNPATVQARFRFALPEAADVELVVYDLLGREVARVVDRRMSAGQHGATVRTAHLPSGAYVYRFRAGPFTETGRLTVVR